jgi:hypothetical protein
MQQFFRPLEAPIVCKNPLLPEFSPVPPDSKGKFNIYLLLSFRPNLPRGRGGKPRASRETLQEAAGLHFLSFEKQKGVKRRFVLPDSGFWAVGGIDLTAL